MEKPTEPPVKKSKFPFPESLTPGQRRLLVLGTSFVLGASCGFVPPHWQVACKGAVKVLLFFVSPS